MKFIFFHLMPWTEITEHGKDWPVANKYFVPEQGTEFYRNYIRRDGLRGGLRF